MITGTRTFVPGISRGPAVKPSRKSEIRLDPRLVSSANGEGSRKEITILPLFAFLQGLLRRNNVVPSSIVLPRYERDVEIASSVVGRPACLSGSYTFRGMLKEAGRVL